jgi:hypothetical protein
MREQNEQCTTNDYSDRASPKATAKQSVQRAIRIIAIRMGLGIADQTCPRAVP